MLDMDFIFLQKITAIIYLLIFFTGRFIWSYIKGKRKKVKVSAEIVSGRFWITLIVFAILPSVLIFNIFDLLEIVAFNSNGFFIYLFGAFLALCGIILMFFARMHRQKDWGFMGDDSGDILFTQGVYSITRHPYYMGAIFLGIGIYLVLNSWFVLSMFPVILFIKNVINYEDKFLHNKFQNKWVVYKQKVGLFPFLGKWGQSR